MKMHRFDRILIGLNPNIQVISEHGEHCSHFDLKIGPAPKVQKIQKTKEQAKAEEEADEAFKKRMARM